MPSAVAPTQSEIPPSTDTFPVTGYIDFDARKASEEGRTTGDDFAVYINPVNESTRTPSPLVVEPLQTFKIMSVVCCVKFSPDGKYLGVGCSKSTEIYDVETMKRVCALTDDTSRKDYYIRSVVFSPDGRSVASGAEDHLVRICDIEKESIKLRLPGHTLDIYSIDWSRDGKFVASASGDRTVRIWDPESGQCLMTLSCDDDPARQGAGDAAKDTGVTSVAIRPSDSRCVAAGAIDDTIRIWDVKTGQLLERLVGHQNSVYAVAFSPTGMSLVSGSLDRTLCVWDLSPDTLQYLAATATQAPSDIPRRRTSYGTRPRHVFKGHKDFILSVAYPGKGSSLGMVDRSGKPLAAMHGLRDLDWIVSASKDRHVTLWDAAAPGPPTAVPVCLLSGHRNSVISVAVSPTGGLMATGSGDMRMRIWRVARSTSVSALAAEPATVPGAAPPMVPTSSTSATDTPAGQQTTASQIHQQPASTTTPASGPTSAAATPFATSSAAVASSPIIAEETAKPPSATQTPTSATASSALPSGLNRTPAPEGAPARKSSLPPLQLPFATQTSTSSSISPTANTHASPTRAQPAAASTDLALSPLQPEKTASNNGVHGTNTILTIVI
eukprot:jgi/Hompol1/1058/HPOL_005496-RA